MTTDDVDQSEASAEPGVAPKELHAGDIASVIAAMNRFLSSFSQNPALKAAQLGLADWLVLALLSQKGADNSRSLAKTLGLSQQRLTQILAALKASGFVQITGSGSKESISVTEQGQSTLDTISAALEPRIAEMLKGRERSVVAIERGLKLLSRVAAAPAGQ